MTTTIITQSSGAYYGKNTPSETLVNNSVILSAPSGGATFTGENALTIYEATGITLVNTGTLNSTYAGSGSGGSGGNAGSGIEFAGTLTQQISIINTATGVIEDTGGAGDGVLIHGGTVVNDGFISGGPSATQNPGFGIAMGPVGGFISNASTGTIAGGGIIGFGQTTLVNAGKVLGPTASNSKYGAIYLKAGGIITNLTTGTISAENGSNGVRIQGGAGTVINAGYITNGSFGGDAVTLTAGTVAGGYANLVVVDPGARFRGLVDGGGAVSSTLELGSGAATGTLSGFGSEYINFGSLQFDAGAAWTVTGNDSASGLGTIAITGFADNDTIDLTGFVATGETFANNALVLSDASNAHATLAIQGTFTSSQFHLSSDHAGGTDIVVCFAAGTLIGTPGGGVQVEKLQTGDLVLTAHNGPRPVKWIGKGKVLSTRGKRTAATPVIVCKGALADNVPNADLRVTKAHSLYIDGVLIPVEFLVNHKTILWDDRAQEVEIYHVELESHDVLIANGAPAESYRDDGNRWLFQNANTGWDLPPQDPYAPVLTGGPVVDAVWRRLLDRTGPRALPPLTEEPDLHLVIDGARVDPEHRCGSLYGFRLPSSPKSVVIASRSMVPAEFGIARDPRSLGVALRRVAIRQGSKFMLFDADDERLTVGFHAYEPDCNLRWTDGCAKLPAEAFARFDKGAEVMLHLGGATQYPDDRASATRVAA